MLPRSWFVAGVTAVFVALPCPAFACSLCDPNFVKGSSTLRQKADQSKMVLYGAAINPRLNNDRLTGTTDIKILARLRVDPILGNRDTITVPRYVPGDPKNPPKYLVFCDVFDGKIDPYLGLPARTPKVVDYLSGAMKLDLKDRSKALLNYYQYFLDSDDADVAFDAFLEFVKSSDEDIGRIAAKLNPERLRRLLLDPKTPKQRLGLFAMLLGACGGAKDAETLRTLIARGDERSIDALDGLLGGYILLQPQQGWRIAAGVLADDKRTFPEQHAILRMVKFFQTWRPRDMQTENMKLLALGVQQGNVADLAIEDLRRWKIWDLTGSVLAQYGKPTHSAPVIERTIIRYALSCPRPEAAAFVARVRKTDPETVKELEEALEFEKRN